MKTKSLFLFAMMLLMSAGVMAQSYTFRVLTAKGQNTSNGKPIRVGAKLNSSDKIEMQAGGYLGLLHNNGQTVELRNKGTYKASELANNLTARAKSDLTARYARYVVSELTSKSEEASGNNRYRHMTKTGAVKRGRKMPVTIIEPSKSERAGDKLEINWFVMESLAKIKKSDVKEYKVTVTDLRNNVLLSENTDTPSYVIDFTRPELKDQKVVLYKVEVADEDKQGKNLVSEAQSVKIAKKAKEVQDNLNKIGDETALGYLIKAQYLEEEKLLVEAAMAYKKAIELAPEVDTYRELYKGFTERTTMSEEAIMAKK